MELPYPQLLQRHFEQGFVHIGLRNEKEKPGPSRTAAQSVMPGNIVRETVNEAASAKDGAAHDDAGFLHWLFLHKNEYEQSSPHRKRTAQTDGMCTLTCSPVVPHNPVSRRQISLIEKFIFRLTFSSGKGKR